MKMDEIIYLADARKSSGYGNLSRVRSLSEQVKSTRKKIIIKTESDFFLQLKNNTYDEYHLPPSDVYQEVSSLNKFFASTSSRYLVTDLFAGEYLKQPNKFIDYHMAIKESLGDVKLITIDDARLLTKKNSYSNLSIVSNTSEKYSAVENKRIVGPAFTIFSCSLLDAKRYLNDKKKYKFFISFGGVDCSFDTYKVIEALYSIKLASPDEGVKVVIGKAFPDWYINKIRDFCKKAGYELTFFYEDYFKDVALSKFVICGEGATKLDALALGVLPIVITQFDHFSKPIRDFIDSGLSYYFGKSSDFSPKNFSEYIGFVLRDTSGYQKKREKGMEIYDGLGGARISRSINNL